MWLMTKAGFYSITRKAKNEYHIRAREKQDIQNLKDALKIKAKLNDWPTSDYQFRIIVNEATYHRVMAYLTELVDYNNFKSMIHTRKDQDRKNSKYSRIWGVMRELDQRSHKHYWKTYDKRQQQLDITDPVARDVEESFPDFHNPGRVEAQHILEGDTIKHGSQHCEVLLITEVGTHLEFVLEPGEDTVDMNPTDLVEVVKWKDA